MLQHKQEERALKRYEGDIIKKQHQLRRTVEDLKNSKFKTAISSHTIVILGWEVALGNLNVHVKNCHPKGCSVVLL